MTLSALTTVRVVQQFAWTSTLLDLTTFGLQVFLMMILLLLIMTIHDDDI